MTELTQAYRALNEIDSAINKDRIWLTSIIINLMLIYGMSAVILLNGLLFVDFLAAVVALLAADNIHAKINTASETIHFTFFSMVFLGLLMIVPQTIVIYATFVAIGIGFFVRRQRLVKRLVNAVTIAVSSLAAIGAYTIFGGVNAISLAEILSIIAAGFTFSLVNFFVLALLIAIATRASFVQQIRHYYIIVPIEMLPPIIAGLIGLLWYFNPLVAGILLTLLTLSFRPQYDFSTRRIIPRGQWNASPYKDVISLQRHAESVGR